MASATVARDMFAQRKAALSATPKASVPLSENWLYRTRQQPVAKDPTRTLYDASEECPDWFQVKSTDLVKNADVAKAPGFDGTMTVLSKISGWITVTPRSQNRAKRLGRHGPFDKSKKGHNLRNVSDLAPQWMQTTAPEPPPAGYATSTGHPTMRDLKKQTFLVDKQQPERSVFSIGDYRHNVITAEEAARHMQTVSSQPKNLLEWQASWHRNSERPVTGKIGSLYN